MRLSIELRAESSDAFKAWRRAQGLDPPSADACATARPLSDAAMRRLLRTYVLDDEGHWQPLSIGEQGPMTAMPCRPPDEAH